MSEESPTFPLLPDESEAYHKGCPLREIDIRRGVFDMQYFIRSHDERIVKLENKVEQTTKDVIGLTKEQSVFRASFDEFRKALEEKLEGIFDTLKEVKDSFSSKAVMGYIQISLIVISTIIIILSNIKNLIALGK